MVLGYLLDEHLRGPLGRAIRCHNARGMWLIDAMRVGDFPELPLGTPDPEILLWAEREGRILVSHDRNTLPRCLADHLNAGNHSPGILILRPRSTIPKVVTFLADAAYASDPSEWQDRIAYIP